MLKTTMLREQSVKTRYFGVWRALLQLSRVNGPAGDKAETDEETPLCLIQQE